MRYVVTGAAGFIGSQLLRTLLERGHDATGWDAFTDYYDPALKEENARGLPVERIDLVEDAARSRRRRRRLPSRRPARRAELRRASSPSTSARTCSRASACSRPRSRRARARCSRPRRRSTATPRRTRRPRTRRRGRSPRTGSRSSRAEHLAQRVRGRSSASTPSTLRYFTIYGPRQRPDMAFARMVACLAESRPFELFGDGTQSRSFTYVDDAVEATIARDGAWRARDDVQRRRRRGGVDARRRSRHSARSPGAGSRSSARRAARGTQPARPPTRPASRDEIGWEPRTLVRGGTRGSVALGR